MGCKGSQVRILSPRPIQSASYELRAGGIVTRGTSWGNRRGSRRKAARRVVAVGPLLPPVTVGYRKLNKPSLPIREHFELTFRGPRPCLSITVELLKSPAESLLDQVFLA